MLNIKDYYTKGIYWLPVILCFSIPVSTSLTTISILLLSASWLLGGGLKKKLEAYWQHPLAPYLLGIFGLYCFGCLYSQGTQEHILERMSDGLRLCLIPIFGYFVTNLKQVKYSFIAFIVAMVITLIAGFAKIYLDLPIGLKYTQAAVFKSHIDTSFFMALAAFYVFYTAFSYQSFRRVGIVLGLLMLYYVFFMSIGRIGYLTVFVIGFYISYLIWGAKGLGIALGALSLFGLGLYELSDSFAQRTDILFQDWSYYQQGRLSESSLGSRIQFYFSSLDLMIQKPLFGWGTGSFGEAYAALSQGAYLFTDNPHSEYLRIGVELGLVGLGLLVLLFVRQWQLYVNIPQQWQVLAKGSLLLFLFGCFVNSWLIDFSQSYFYVLFCALSFSTLKTLRPGDLVEVPLH